MAIFNLVGAVGNIKPNKLEDTVSVTGNATVPTSDSLEVFNAARIDTIDGTPADNTFVVTIDGQAVSVPGNTSAAQTAADLVVALNASVLSSFVLRTWENPSGAIIAGIDDVGIADDAYVLTITGTGSATITDFVFKFTINMSAGVNLAESGTGFINYQGVRGTYVLYNSSAANPKIGDWAFVSFNGTGINSNRWCIGANSDFGHMAFQGHAPAVDLFSYNIIYNTGTGSLFNNSSAAGSAVFEDIAIIRAHVITKSGSMTQTVSRLTIFNVIATSLSQIQRVSTWNDISFEGKLSGSSFLPLAGNLITVNRLYFKNVDNSVNSLFGGAGDLVINDSLIEQGGIAVLFSGVGSLALNRSDVTNAGKGNAPDEGLFNSGAGTFTTTDVHLGGTTGFDLSVISSSTAIPDGPQHKNLTAITTPKRTPNQPRTYSGISVDVSVAEEITFTFTTDVPAGSYVELIDSNGVIVANSPFDAPSVLISEIGVTLNCKVTDFGLKGQKYKNAHVHKLTTKSGKFTWRIVSWDPNDNQFNSDIQSEITVTGAASVPLFPDIEMNIDGAVTLEVQAA